MAFHRSALPQTEGGLFLTYTGMETDLLFNKGFDLPGFASYPLLETDEGRAALRGSYESLIDTCQDARMGVILESPTWVANRDRGAVIGYSPETLRRRNIEAVELMVEIRNHKGDLPTIISANIGPRSDAYAPSERMSPEEAEAYHCEQIAVFAKTEIDLISGYTVAYPEEAIGMVRAAKTFDLPVVIGFTVETDGRLPIGIGLGDAIELVDQATDQYASYFMINCAHPDHFRSILTDDKWMMRLRGIVANASRCSHAELDEAEVLDAGNPAEFGRQLSEIHHAFPQITVFGGCCGTDMRHMSSVVRQLNAV